MRKNLRIYLWISFAHLIFLVIWVAIFKETNPLFTTFAFETIISSHGGYWFFHIGIYLIIRFHSKRKNSLFLLWSYIAPIIGLLTFSVFGMRGIVESLMKSDYANVLRSTTSLFWAYGLFQALLYSYYGHDLGLSLRKKVSNEIKNKDIIN